MRLFDAILFVRYFRRCRQLAPTFGVVRNARIAWLLVEQVRVG